MNTSPPVFGIVVIGSTECSYGTLVENHLTILHKFSSKIPVKRNDSESAIRFGRIQMEKRHNYIRHVSDMAVHLFTTDEILNIDGLIMVGPPDMIIKLYEMNIFDVRLKNIVISIVSNDEEYEFNRVIELSEYARLNFTRRQLNNL